MDADERETLRKRFRYRCGYCGVLERDVGAALTLDHLVDTAPTIGSIAATRAMSSKAISGNRTPHSES